uniref:P2X purinoceptor n=1 Tax=Melopsittacus undulatus TaxID=13146 RepID=A0A8C6NDZ7_MELUD
MIPVLSLWFRMSLWPGHCPRRGAVEMLFQKGKAIIYIISFLGIKTGKCVMFNTTHSTCEIYGWCPVENNTLSRKPLLAEAENFTLFIRNTVHFTKFNFSRCNVLQTNDPYYFKSCTYDPSLSPSCPIFRVHDMVEAAGETFGDLALLGGSIGVRIEWNCDLDRPATHCQPQYSFSLQDRRYNFRTASYYWDSQRRLYRTLLKLYGIRFDISVHGQAGKFSIIPAAVSFGTGVAFFGAATVVCDLVLLYLDAKADFYWKEKFEEICNGSRRGLCWLLSAGARTSPSAVPSGHTVWEKPCSEARRAQAQTTGAISTQQKAGSLEVNPGHLDRSEKPP